MDYSKGLFAVFDAQSRLIGRVDENEFVRAPGMGGQLLYRLDGEVRVTGSSLAFNHFNVMQA